MEGYILYLSHTLLLLTFFFKEAIYLILKHFEAQNEATALRIIPLKVHTIQS
jgi:hypothetical protein